jgi:methylphosphotriester-DNA--protein-cysteine methyltransferase
MRLLPAGCSAAHPSQRMGVVAAALRYFASHCAEGIAMADVAHALGISEECLDVCFDQSRGMTPFEALHHHRLNRLFSAIAERPGQRLGDHLRQCGLQANAGTLACFEDTFGIALEPYRQICRRAAADRDFRRSHRQRRDLTLRPERGAAAGRTPQPDHCRSGDAPR